MKIIILHLSGLHCASCANNIDLTLEDLDGVKNSTTSYQKSEVKIEFDPSKTGIDFICKAIANLGYEVTLPLHP